MEYVYCKWYRIPLQDIEEFQERACSFHGRDCCRCRYRILRQGRTAAEDDPRSFFPAHLETVSLEEFRRKTPCSLPGQSREEGRICP